MTGRPRVRIHYHRPPDREQIFDQGVVTEDESVIVTLAENIEFAPPMEIDGAVVLEAGSSVVWFTFPGLWHDIGRFHRADGSFSGIYANVLTPVRIEGRRWYTTDLFLDVWIGPDGAVRVLDMEEFEEAAASGVIDPETASRARTEAAALRGAAERGEWPPPIVQLWTLERALEGPHS